MVYVWAAAANTNLLNTGASTLLHVEIMKKMQSRGFPNIDITMANEPDLSKFASRLNPTLVPYYEIQSWIFDEFRAIKK
jgi:hypothetical protein